ncbi:MAG: hypothetical protein QF561_03700 [Phycisphaerales bacterium]|jgi:hypothetical protein|nr:hypothetical protein [Phycisphaerales bacterium]
MFGAMTVAICLMAFNMVGGKSPEANASMNAGYDYRGGTEPTIVWYGTVQVYHDYSNQHVWEIVRAWSDGTVEARANKTVQTSCGSSTCTAWRIVSNPNEGLAALSDLNDDAVVNVDDLLKIVDDWGPAPPNVIPPSDCPLAMINP